MKYSDTSSLMLVITVAFILAVWTLIVAVVTVILPYAFDLKAPWPLIALAWSAPFLVLGGPFVWKRAGP
jgi:hypothetical protein